MSDTPISDSTPHNVGDLGMLCRTLERLASVRLDYINQLEANHDAANAEIDRLAAKVAQLYEGAEEQKQRIKRLEEVTNDPHALWANWLRGDVKLPVGIGDVRQYQDRIKRLEEENNELRAEEARLLNTNGELERRIKHLEDRINRAAMAFFRDGSDGQVASGMLAILEEERGKP